MPSILLLFELFNNALLSWSFPFLIIKQINANYRFSTIDYHLDSRRQMFNHEPPFKRLKKQFLF